MSKAILPCPECGSNNILMYNTYTDELLPEQKNSIFAKLSDRLREIAAEFSSLAGQKIAICKACGHTFYICIL